MQNWLKLVIIPAILLMFPFLTADAQTVTPIFVNIDISTTPNPNDFPFGITCTDSTYRYMTLSAQGALVRIEKSNNAVTIFDNNAVAAGEDWYSLVTDPNTGKIYIGEKDTGRTRVFEPSSNTFTAIISIPENIAGGLVTYTTSYSADPNKITVDETAGGHGNHAYEFGFGSFGELKFTNGFIWQVIDYNYDFDVVANGLGVSDVSFHGVARINPADNTVTRYAIAGATALRGISIDVVDPTILWITDTNSEKLYKFNTDTGLVTDTVNLPLGSKPKGVTNDATTIYVAENQLGNGVITSKILSVSKSGFSISEIDTSAVISNGKSGTFSVYVVLGFLVWTDESSHIGTVQISNPNIKLVINTSSNTNANHFGCLEGSNFIFAGKGSVVQGTFSLGSSSETSHGDSCGGDCYSPHLGTDENSKFFYKDGLTINGVIYEMKNVMHNQNDKIIEMLVGQPIVVVAKAQDSYPDNISSCELAIGIQKGHFAKQDATYILGVKRSFDGVLTEYFEGDKTAYRLASVNMYNKDQNVFCEFIWTPTRHIEHDMFAIELKDIHAYTGTYFINEGIEFKGISKVGTPVFDYMDKDGMIHTLTIIDQTLEDLTLASDENGNNWKGDFGKLWSKEYTRPNMTSSVSKYHGYDRDDYFEFKQYRKGQELLATQIFDSSKIQGKLPDSFAYESTNYYRLHDPVPNMMKAQADYAVKKLTKIVK